MEDLTAEEGDYINDFLRANHTLQGEDDLHAAIFGTNYIGNQRDPNFSVERSDKNVPSDDDDDPYGLNEEIGDEDSLKDDLEGQEEAKVDASKRPPTEQYRGKQLRVGDHDGDSSEDSSSEESGNGSKEGKSENESLRWTAGVSNQQLFSDDDEVEKEDETTSNRQQLNDVANDPKGNGELDNDKDEVDKED